jgi:hypothetical protein
VRAAAADELLVLSSAVHGASRDAAARLMRLARARIAARSGTPASRTPVTEQDWSQVTTKHSGECRSIVPLGENYSWAGSEPTVTGTTLLLCTKF